MADKHITQINKTLAQFVADADDGQHGQLTDQSYEHIYRVGSDFYLSPPARKTTNGSDFTYLTIEADNLYAQSDMKVGAYLYHYGDAGADSHLLFEEDELTITMGGVDFLNIVEAAQDYVEWNTAQADVDYIINTLSLEALNISGLTGNAVFSGTAQILRLGIGTAASATVKALISLDDATVYSASMALPLTVAQIRNEDTTQLSSALLGFYSAKGSNIWNIGAVGSASSYQGSFVIGNRTAANVLTERVSILQSGFVGLGASIPESLLALWSTAPTLTLHNTTEQNTDGGRVSNIDFIGEQDGTEISTLIQFKAQHDGTGDDKYGEMIFLANNNTTPIEVMRYNTNQALLGPEAEAGPFLRVGNDTSALGATLQICGYASETPPVLDIFACFNNQDNTGIGSIYYSAYNNNSEILSFAEINGYLSSAVDGAETGAISFSTLLAGVMGSKMTLYSDKVTVWKPLIFSPSSAQVIDAVGDTILANAGTIILNPDGDYTMTSAPTIANGTAGQLLYITCANAEANTVTVQDQDTLASSNLHLGAASRAISGKDVLVLLFDGTTWNEVSYANN